MKKRILATALILCILFCTTPAAFAAIEMKVGEAETFSVNPGTTIYSWTGNSWRSSNDSVVSVSPTGVNAGRVKALKPGRATITALISYRYGNRGQYSGSVDGYWDIVVTTDGSTPTPTPTSTPQPTKYYTIRYDANGGSGAPASQRKTQGTTLSLSSTEPTRASVSDSCTITFDARGGSVSPSSKSVTTVTSYTFTAWNTAANGSGTSYSPGGSYSANADATLYAQWSSNTKTAMFTLPTPVRNGYTFKGWATNSGASSGFTGEVTISGAVPFNNITLYAIWQPAPNTYTVSYNANGGSGAPASQTKTPGTALTLSSTKPTRASSSAGSYTVTLNANGGSVSTGSLTASRTTSYTFSNWNTSASGSGTSYNPGASYTADANVTLYAQWSSSTSTSSVTLPTPTRSGYAFKGWATSSSASSGATGSYTPSGNVTLYAVWGPGPYSGTWGSLVWNLDNNGLLTISGSGNMDDFTFRDTQNAWRTHTDEIRRINIASGVTSISSCSFDFCSNLVSISIPDSVTTIADAFYHCTSLTSVTIPAQVTSIGNYAFSGCSSLTGITIPHHVSSIGDEAFSGCSSLVRVDYLGTEAQWNSISIGSGNEPLLNATINFISIIDSGTWGSLNWTLDYNGLLTISGSGSMNRFDYEDSQNAWRKYTSDIRRINIASGVTSISSCSFDFCSNLVSISIPDSVTSIADAFYHCTSLTSVTIPKKVTFIAQSAFSGCSSLESVTLPDQLTSIKNYAFNGCSSLTSITIPQSVSSIGDNAFNGCSSLVRVNYRGTEAQWNSISIGSSNEPLLNATINFISIIDSGTWGSLNWTLDYDGLLTISGSGQMDDFEAYDTLAWRSQSGKVTSIVIKSGITSIGDFAFYNFANLKSVSIPAGVTSIGFSGFCGCSALAGIRLPDSLKELSYWVFGNCTSLTSIRIPDGVTSFAQSTFAGCSNLKSVTLPKNLVNLGTHTFEDCTSLTSIVLPDRLERIGTNSFKGCTGLTSITIPASVTSINSGSFDGCSRLSKVTYKGSLAQWNKISVEYGNTALYNAQLIVTVSTDFRLPAYLTEIEEQAFEGGTFSYVHVPEQVTTIGARAFASCPNLHDIDIPESAVSISSTAFAGVSNLTIHGVGGSYAEFYASKNGFGFVPDYQ